MYNTQKRSRYSDWLRAGRQRGRSSSPGRVKNFLFSMSSGPALGSTEPSIQRVSGALSPGVKRPVREADHSPPTSAEVKKMWIYTAIKFYLYIPKCLHTFKNMEMCAFRKHKLKYKQQTW
jgi:hypothetical protein